MIEVIFLGTSSMVPTKERNHTAILLSYKNQGLLFDCGEGTQRQFKIANIPVTKVTKLFITHWHGDHTLGIPGMIQTLGASEYKGTLEIYGPDGTKRYMSRMFEAFLFDKRIEISIKEIEEGVAVETGDFIVKAYKMNHSTETLGYRFEEKDRRRIHVAKAKKMGLSEGPIMGKLSAGLSVTFKGKKISPKDVTYIVKGKVVSFTGDTGETPEIAKLGKDADLLITEATFASKLEEKGNSYQHLTGRQAGLAANAANAKMLVLTHFSARYTSAQEVLDDAKDVFSNARAAHDLMKVRL